MGGRWGWVGLPAETYEIWISMESREARIPKWGIGGGGGWGCRDLTHRRAPAGLPRRQHPAHRRALLELLHGLRQLPQRRLRLGQLRRAARPQHIDLLVTEPRRRQLDVRRGPAALRNAPLRHYRPKVVFNPRSKEYVFWVNVLPRSSWSAPVDFAKSSCESSPERCPGTHPRATTFSPLVVC